MIEAGARREWDELTAKLRPYIARRVSAADVEDVMQEVFLRMQRGLGGLRDEERFGPWVYQVTRSAIADQHREAQRHPLAADRTADEAAAPEEEDDLAERVLVAHLAPFVATLPSPYREALTLTELEGLSQKDAAVMLGLSLSGMKSRVQRGRARLREALEACCEIALDPRGRVTSCEPRPDAVVPCVCCLPPRSLIR